MPYFIPGNIMLLTNLRRCADILEHVVHVGDVIVIDIDIHIHIDIDIDIHIHIHIHIINKIGTHQ